MKRFWDTARLGLAGLAAQVLWAGPVFAQETVDFDPPVSMTFLVNDVDSSTDGDFVTTVNFSNANLTAGKALRVSVKADSLNFSPPAGDAIPASQISWTTSNAIGGTGWSGSLRSDTYTQLFLSIANPGSGSVDVTWRLEATGGGIRAGNHTLRLRWKVESVSP